MRFTVSELPQPIISALPVIRRLRKHHFEAVFVGGSVRDTVLGLPVNDVDIATSARPEQVVELFDRSIPTGLQHGTITVIEGGTTYEVTTFRQESKYEGHRKPENVQYISDLEGDLLRRDFTINAMAIDEDGLLIDPFGGLKDLQRSLLRCVGDADARFQEDALRMLRAVRFIGVYKLAPAHQTWRALVRHRSLMNFIAMERVYAELDKMMAADRPDRALFFTAASGLLYHLKERLPERAEQAIQSAYHSPEAAKALKSLSAISSIELRWAALMISLKLDKESALSCMLALRFPKKRSDKMLALLAVHNEMCTIAASRDLDRMHESWLKAILRYGQAVSEGWLTILRSLDGIMTNGLTAHLQELESWLHNLSLYSLKQLRVDGRELARHMKREAGPWISDMLNRLLFEAAAGRVCNDKEPLLQLALKWNKEDAYHEK